MDVNSLRTHHESPVAAPPDEAGDAADWRGALGTLQELEAAEDETAAAHRADAVVERFLRTLGYGAIANHWRRVRERAR